MHLWICAPRMFSMRSVSSKRAPRFLRSGSENSDQTERMHSVLSKYSLEAHVRNQVLSRHSSIVTFSQKRTLTCALSDDSDKPAHSRSLIRIFTVRILDRQGRKVSSCGQGRLRLDRADAQADLSLRWARMSEGAFSDVAVHNSIDLLTLI